MKIIFASNNKNKVQEIQNQVPKSIEIVTLEEIGCTEDIVETGSTLEENAIIKANYVTEKYGLPCFADDTGLEIDALNGEPGVYSARYAGEPKDDQKNMDKLLSNLIALFFAKVRKSLSVMPFSSDFFILKIFKVNKNFGLCTFIEHWA